MKTESVMAASMKLASLEKYISFSSTKNSVVSFSFG